MIAVKVSSELKTRWRPYPEYKDSGVEWLRAMPDHWQLLRVKFMFKRMQRPVRPEDEVVTAFRDGIVTLRSNRREDGFTFALKEIGYQGIRNGDLIIHAMDGFAGAIGISDSDGKATPVYSALRPLNEEDMCQEYYAYLMRFLALNGYISSLAKGIRERSTEFRHNEINELVLPVFTCYEQENIAEFLSRETAHIDGLIAKKERQIELLKEKRTALISHAVTKGLDTNVKMKDSCVEWLGDIPRHWNMKPLKLMAQLISGQSPNESTYNIDGNGAVLVNGPAEYSEGDFGYTRELKWTTDPKKWAPKESLLFCLRGSTTGRLNITHDRISIGRGVAAIIADGDQAYLNYAMVAARPHVLGTSNGATFPSVTSEILGCYVIPQPSLIEQKNISKYISQETATQDAVAQKIKESIEKLQEYRTALISAAVTGKIDVRGEVV